MKYILVLFAFAFVGCSSIPMADDARDQAAKNFTSNQNAANVYAIRNSFVGGAWPADLLVDGKYVGQIRPGQFLNLSVKPGKHKISTRTKETKTIDVELKSNQNYFYRLVTTFKFGGPGADIEVVEANEAMKEIRNSKLAETYQLQQ